MSKREDTFGIAKNYVEAHELFGPRYLFPLAYGQKGAPCIKNNLADASVDLKQLEDWSKQFPGCLWGVSAKKSGLVCIDIDMGAEKDGMASVQALKARGLKLPPTETDRTPGGGWHLVYIGPHRFSAGKIGPFIDTPNYFVAPGCVRYDGKAYRVGKPLLAVDCPQWALDIIHTTAKSTRPIGDPIPLDLFREMLADTPYEGGPNADLADRRSYDGWLRFAMSVHDAAGGLEDDYLFAFCDWCLADPVAAGKPNWNWDKIARHWESFK